MSCVQTIADYGLRSLGIGERLLPRSDFTLCQQFTLIGSGMIWNLYFGVLALTFGFFFSNALALGKASPAGWQTEATIELAASRADAARECGIIAEGPGGQRLGSVFCMAEGAEAPDIARLRLFQKRG